MLRPERYFDELYEYVDLWAAGFVKAYSPDIGSETYARQQSRLVEALIERFDVVNRLRRAIGLKEMGTEGCYDYYVNNLPEYDDTRKVIDLYTFDRRTRELAEMEEGFRRNPDANAYLHVMGAPDMIIDNSYVVQQRLDHINRLLVESGNARISPHKTEEILTTLLTSSNW